MSRPAKDRFKFSKGDAGTGDEENPAKTAKQAFDILKTNFNQANPETAQEFLPFEDGWLLWMWGHNVIPMITLPYVKKKMIILEHPI